ncbi:alpha/beta fold hydrolase [Nocardia transvalensis]|uniref:alpha/beta fold hydrolase n=1 Tax=Nocardia transvalensis TaxID=37333 RepID=UPI0018934D22|nr:alpha/beta hydrolase [Nocardia transvalensis]MBF6327068.1 alpha/beta hydrolase [Nocardia transvalensis]
MRACRRMLMALSAPLTALALSSGVAAAAPEQLPTVVLVHGAFADPASWDGVAGQLRELGYPVVAPGNPLRGPSSDAAAIGSTLDSISGPVILVGHSYGGAVINNAGRAANVRALVYVSALAPGQGEPAALGTDPIRYPGSKLMPPVVAPKLADDPYGRAGDLYIDPAYFHDAFAADVPADTAARMAATQHSVAPGAFLEPNGAPACDAHPSWWLIPQQDNAVPPAAQRAMAGRCHSRVTEISGSHAVLVSHPEAVTALVRQADAATR